MLESLEGKRGHTRIKQPFPAERGLYGMPTLINNVETLAHLPAIVVNGADWYRNLGTASSPGTKIFCLSGDVTAPGSVEVEMGVTLRQLIDGFAGGIKGGKTFKTALLGGAAGTFVPQSDLDVAMDFDALKERGAVLGSGAVIVLAEDRPIAKMLHSILRFFEHESCGKCVPCRVGTRHLVDLLAASTDGVARQGDWVRALVDQSELMAKTALCPLGQSPVLPIKSAARHFGRELRRGQAPSRGGAP